MGARGSAAQRQQTNGKGSALRVNAIYLLTWWGKQRMTEEVGWLFLLRNWQCDGATLPGHAAKDGAEPTVW
ncbi:hypothetical protein LSM04_001106 [Trypanosoma melophagium]|uniref:uncharacterized protein n=1 Tax=Trypanosoma melophagium TaxID=715481 RepID=UPI00351A5935|nr:hypothetical protein LSM04_001106 [Trypanosoma melophagium]